MATFYQNGDTLYNIDQIVQVSNDSGTKRVREGGPLNVTATFSDGSKVTFRGDAGVSFLRFVSKAKYTPRP